MQIRLKRMDGCCDIIEVRSPDVLVSELKTIIEEKLQVPRSRLRLISGGIVLKDQDSLHSYSIHDDSVIHVVIRPEGIPPSQPAPRQMPNIRTQDLGNGTLMSSVTLDGNSDVNISEIISQMMGVAHNAANNITVPGIQPAPLRQPTPAEAHSPPDSNIIMASAFLTALNRTAVSSQHQQLMQMGQPTLGVNQGGDSLGSLLQQLLHTLHALQIPVLTLSQKILDRERGYSSPCASMFSHIICVMLSFRRCFDRLGSPTADRRGGDGVDAATTQSWRQSPSRHIRTRLQSSPSAPAQWSRCLIGSISSSSVPRAFSTSPC